MTIRPPILVAFGGCTYEKALDIIQDRHLRNCEPAPRVSSGIWFENENDLLVFKLEINEAVQIDERLMVVGPDQGEAVEAFISNYGLESRTERADLLIVRFWDIGDRQDFEEELDFLRCDTNRVAITSGPLQ